MNRQTDDEASDPFVFRQFCEILRVEGGRSTRVVLVRACNANVCISGRDTDSHRAIIDSSNPHHSIGAIERMNSQGCYLVLPEFLRVQLVHWGRQIGGNRLASVVTHEMTMLQKTDRVFVHSLIVHKKAVKHRQDPEISCSSQPCAFHGYNAIIVTWQ